MVLKNRERVLIDLIKQKLEINIRKINEWGGGTSVKIELKYDGEVISSDSYML